MKVKINEDECIGCGACESICSEVFEVDDIAKVKEEAIEDNESDIEEAVECCPVNCITIEE